MTPEISLGFIERCGEALWYTTPHRLTCAGGVRKLGPCGCDRDSRIVEAVAAAILAAADDRGLRKQVRCAAALDALSGGQMERWQMDLEGIV